MIPDGQRVALHGQLDPCLSLGAVDCMLLPLLHSHWAPQEQGQEQEQGLKRQDTG